MLLTRDVQLDWQQVPDLGGGRLPCGFVQFQIKSFEEQMSSSEGVDKNGDAKVAKYMLVCTLEAQAPDEAAGISRKEYFVLGSNDDPMMQKAETFYNAIGARSLKRMLADAQVPWSSSLVATLNSSIGAMFIAKVDHKMEKRRDTGEDIVAVRIGTSYKLGEKMPQYIPCNLPACDMCQQARAQGVGSAAAAFTPPTAPPQMPTAPPVAAPMTASQIPKAAAPVVPTPPSAPPVQAPPIVPVSPSIPQAVPPVAPPPGSVASPPPDLSIPMPQTNAPVQAPAAPAAQTAPPAAGMVPCKLCGASVPEAEFGAHIAACAMKAAQGVGAGVESAQQAPAFKQEV